MQDDRLARSLGYALVKAFRRVNRDANRALSKHELTAEQAHILLLLWFLGPMKIGDLQRSLLLSSGTLTGAIDRMEKSGLVRRVQDEADKRAFRVEPVLRNRRGIEATLEAFEEESFAMLSKSERRTLLDLLKKVSG
jgi:MarR family transcriptional regulator, 2-MHQ and catechol-resistance regulon repressor